MAQQIARVWLNPFGEKWQDVALQEGATIQQLWSIAITEGVVATNMVVIPRQSIFMMQIIGEASTSSALYTIPGGKPN